MGGYFALWAFLYHVHSKSEAVKTKGKGMANSGMEAEFLGSVGSGGHIARRGLGPAGGQQEARSSGRAGPSRAEASCLPCPSGPAGQALLSLQTAAGWGPGVGGPGPVGPGRALRSASSRLTGPPPGCRCRYSPKSPSLQSETVRYKRGLSRQFSLPSFKIDFSEWKDEEVTSGGPLPELCPLWRDSLSFLAWLISIKSGCWPGSVCSAGLWSWAWSRLWLHRTSEGLQQQVEAPDPGFRAQSGPWGCRPGPVRRAFLMGIV